MVIKICVNVEMTAVGHPMNSATEEIGVGDQALDACQFLEEKQDWPGIKGIKE